MLNEHEGTPMMKYRLLAAVALILSVMGWAVAQGAAGGPKVLIDKDRNALVVHQKEEPSTGKGAATLNAGVDLGPGLSTYKLDLDLKDEVGAKGGNVALYSEMGDKSSLLVGQFNVPVPPDQKIAVKADGKLQAANNVGHVDATVDAS